ncbi:4736_t:CDS:2, partial [Rhizophagus irregularis]
QHKSTEKTTDDMDISQDTFASSSESGGAAKSNTDNQVTPENLDAPIDGEKNDEMIVDNGKIDNQTDDQSFNKDNQKNGDTNDIISDNHSEIFNKAKPILVKIKKDSIPGNNIIQKKFNLRKQLAGINVTLAGGVILNKKEPEFIILPIMKNDYDKIINLEIDIIDDEQSHENGEDAESSTNSKVKEIIKFTPYQKTKKVFTEEEIKDRNCRTIKVINIPIEIPNYQIRAVFNKYGEIEENGFYTRIRNLYIQAFITYKKEESLQKFYKGIWSEWIGKHQVLIVPKILSEDEIEKRSMYTVKLTGLPWNSTAYDIHEALEVNNPKYIFIPRNPNNNKPLNYAIVYYENDEDIGIAAERNIIFCNRTLHWGTPGEKSCHRCGSFDHLISKCDIEPSAKPRVMNRKQKLKEFRQENNKKFKKGSYANVTKQNSFEKRQQRIFTQIKQLNENLNKLANDFKKIQQENYRIKSEFYKYKENKSTTSSGKNIKVNQDRSTIALQNENNKRSRVDNEQLEASGSSDIENSLNKQNNEINRFGDALSTM